MRNATKNHSIMVYVSKEVVSTSEKITKIEEDKNTEIIKIEVAYSDDNGEVIATNGFIINGEKYELLMSESPEFAPGKPKNEYREEDIWYIIDKIQEEENATIPEDVE